MQITDRRAETEKIYSLAYLIAAGCVLQVSESLFPHPLPGMRLGLANIMTLVSFEVYGFMPGFTVAILRPVAGSLLLGSFLTPGFLLSLCGSLAASGAMALLLLVNRLKGKGVKLFSPVGVSIAGAAAHGAAQVFVSYSVLIRHKGILALLPPLLLGSLATGYLTGVFARRLLERGNAGKFTPAVPENIFLPEGSPVKYELLKVAACFILMVLAIILAGIDRLIIIVPAALGLGLASGMPFKKFFSQARVLWALLAGTFLLHALFTPGRELWSLSFIRISQQGASNALEVSARIFLLMYLSSILLWKTRWADFFRMAGERLFPSRAEYSLLIPLALSIYPLVWGKVNRVKPKTLRGLLDTLVADGENL